MPPTIGTAMRRINSDPVALLQRIGSKPSMIAITVIILGRTRSAAPAMIARSRSARVRARPSPFLRPRAARKASRRSQPHQPSGSQAPPPPSSWAAGLGAHLIILIER